MRLGLGSAQFGMPYGATNSVGVPDAAAVSKILEMARGGNIHIIDTAPGYGNAERVLGELLPEDWHVRLVTKTASAGDGPITERIAGRVHDVALQSAERLYRRPLHGLLVHHGTDLLKPGGDRLFAVLQRLKEEGVIEKIGASVYGGEEIDAILARFSPDIIQLPYNLCDRRLDDSGQIRRLSDANVEIHVRSIFLQGTLLTPEEHIPNHLAFLRPHLRRLTEQYGCGSVDRVAACLSAAAHQPVFDAVVVGVTTPEEMSVLLRAVNRAKEIAVERDAFQLHDSNILDPRIWPSRDELLAHGAGQAVNLNQSRELVERAYSVIPSASQTFSKGPNQWARNLSPHFPGTWGRRVGLGR